MTETFYVKSSKFTVDKRLGAKPNIPPMLETCISAPLPSLRHARQGVKRPTAFRSIMQPRPQHGTAYLIPVVHVVRKKEQPWKGRRVT
jgi:hypothetical protein